MTFKHVKFQDSAVMRSLEKVAKEKGLIKQEDLVKTASSPDLSPTPALLVNLLKLSEGLRAKGFEKAAIELENKTLAYRRAQTLYETSKEKGEDLVDRAHPKGSHKLEDVDGDEAVFETILDQQLKNLKMVGRNPTGKLASTNDILGAVRVVLGQEASNSDDLLSQIREQMSVMMASVRKLDNLTSGELTFSLDSGYVPHLDGLSKNPTLDSLKEIQKTVSKMRWRLKPGSMFGVSEDLWSQIEPIQTATEVAVNKAIDLRVKYNQAKSKDNQSESPQTRPEAPGGRVGVTTVMNASGKQFMEGVNAALGQLKAWTVAVNNDPDNDANDKNQAMNWINERTTELNGLKNQFMGEQDPNTQNEQAPGFITALNKSRYVRENAQFKKVWIG